MRRFVEEKKFVTQQKLIKLSSTKSKINVVYGYHVLINNAVNFYVYLFLTSLDSNHQNPAISIRTMAQECSYQVIHDNQLVIFFSLSE